MKNKSRKNPEQNNITSWLIATLGEDSYIDTFDSDGHTWFHADELYNYLNGNRICCNLPDGHNLYRLAEDEYLVYDIERQPSVYVNEMGAMKMLHNVISPVTVGIFNKVGLDRIKQIIENNSLAPNM